MILDAPPVIPDGQDPAPSGESSRAPRKGIGQFKFSPPPKVRKATRRKQRVADRSKMMKKVLDLSLQVRDKKKHRPVTVDDAAVLADGRYCYGTMAAIVGVVIVMMGWRFAH